MLKELLKHLSTPAPEHIKALGYLKELIAIEARYRLCKSGWDSHIKHTKETILSCIDLCPDRHKALIIGSGNLIDLPLAELCSAFEHVVLVDIYHMPELKKVCNVFSNISLVSADVTGIALKLYDSKPKPEGLLPEPLAYIPQSDDASLVVSLNILSQLPIVPSYFLTDKLKWDEESAKLKAWQRDIMQSHYDALNNLNCTVCLISDWMMLYKAKDGSTIESHITAPILQDIQANKQWDWLIAPLGTESKKYSITLKVKAVIKKGYFSF